VSGAVARFSAFLCLFTAVVVPAAAHAVSIDFRVRMSHQIELGNFDPTTEFVDLAGPFNGWGTEELIVLSDADGDSIHEVTVDGFTPGETIEFKFRLNGEWDGREEFPGGGPNRSYTVRSSGNEILVWYGDRAPDAGVGELSWWNDTVFYEIFVRSFHDSDGDGIGDFQGLTDKLDYLNDGDPSTDDDLGVTGIWLMPIHESPTYHGYDTIDYRSINPDYGTLEDFRTFLDAAHARGIRVIIDYVMNHASTQHPWFIAARQGNPTYRDHFVWSPSDPGQTGPWGQPVWHRDASGYYYYGLFWSGMPDLNYDEPAVRTAMFDTAAWWLDTIGVDGFRLDAVLYIDENDGQLQNTPETFDFWHDFNLHVKSVDPEAMSVGEAWTNSSTVRQYVIEDRLDLCFEFELANAMLGAVNSGDAQGLAYEADQVYGLYPYLQYATFLTNHDQDRVMNVVGQDVDRMKVAAGIYLTQPGVPFLYYGEEVGMLGTKPDPEIRRPMQWTGGPNAGFTTGVPWNEIGPNAADFNVADLQQDPNSLWSWYRDLVGVRNDTPALRRGEYLPLATGDPAVLAYLRRYETQTVLCVINVGDTARSGVTLDGTSDRWAAGDVVLRDLLGTGPDVDTTIDASFDLVGLDLDAHDVRIYEVTRATGVDEPTGDPETGLHLRPLRPNPFDASTTIRYTVSETTQVRLAVYDLAGREVARLHEGSVAAGTHTVHWSGRDDRRRRLGSGVYFVRLQADGRTRVQKAILSR
jgi:glycosidase